MDEKKPNKNLRRERELKGWSQRALAGFINTNEQAVNRWESGLHKPNRHFQTQLCQIFGKNAAELGFMDEPEVTNERKEAQGQVDKECPIEYPFSHQLKQDNEQQEMFTLLSQAIPQDIISPASEQGGIDLNKLRRLLLKGTLGLATGASLSELGPLVINQPTSVTILNEGFVTKANATIKYCWQLYYSGESFLIEMFLPTFLTQVALLVQQPSKYQKQLTYIISQAYQLSCELATDQENYGSALDLGQRALMYAEYAGDIDLQVAVLMRLANLYFHRKQSLYALRTYQQAIPLLNDASPLLCGRIYAGLAEVYAMRNQKQEALSQIGLAHEHYPVQPNFDRAYYYTHITRYSLYVFGEGQTRLYLNQPKEAAEQFTYVEKQLLGSETEILSRVDLFYYQAEASRMLGDLENSSVYVQEAVKLAKNANSRLYYNKILATYQEMRKKWQHESKVSDLEELFQPW